MPAAKTAKNAVTIPVRPVPKIIPVPLLQKRNAETTATTATQPAQAAV